MLIINKNNSKNKSRRKEEIFDENIPQYYDVDIWDGTLDIKSQKVAVKHMIESWSQVYTKERLFKKDYGNNMIEFIHKSFEYFAENFIFDQWLDKVVYDIQVITIDKTKSSLDFDNGVVEITIFYAIRGTNITDSIDLNYTIKGN